MVGFGSDGASVMTGRLNGVGVQLAKLAQHVVLIHCMAHRLALVCVDAVKETPYLKDYSSKLGQLYAYFSCSSLRHEKLELIQDVMDDEKVRLKEPIAVRWLAMHNAVIALHKTWASVVAFFAKETTTNAMDLTEFITTYTFVAFTSLLSDALTVITDLSKKFQTECMDVSAVNVHVNVALATLQGMKLEPGTCLAEFYETLQVKVGVDADGNKTTSFWYKGVHLECVSESADEFNSLRDNYLDSLIEGLEIRMCNGSTRILEAFSLLEPQMARSLSADEIARLIDLLDSHYKVKKRPSEDCETGFSNDSECVDEYKFVNVPVFRKELARLTPLFSGSYSGLRFEGLARMLLIRHRDDFPEACKLAEIGLCLPVSTASCERGFSLQNRIKVKSRTRLLPENLEMLMKLAIAPDVEVFPLRAAVSNWYSARRRRLGRLYQPSHSQVKNAQDQAPHPCPPPQETEEEIVGMEIICDQADDYE